MWPHHYTVSPSFAWSHSLSADHHLGLLPKTHIDASPRISQQHVDRDQARRERLLTAAGEVERIASGFQGLAAHDPRLSVKLNTIRANRSLLSVDSESPNMAGQRYLHAIDEASNVWA